MYGVSGSWFRDLGFLQVSGFEYGVVDSGFRYGVSRYLVSGTGLCRFRYGFSCYLFGVFGYGVFDVRVAGSGFLVLCSGFARFGVTMFRCTGYRGSGLREVRGFRGSGFWVRGFRLGFLMLGFFEVRVRFFRGGV